MKSFTTSRAGLDNNRTYAASLLMFCFYSLCFCNGMWPLPSSLNMSKMKMFQMQATNIIWWMTTKDFYYKCYNYIVHVLHEQNQMKWNLNLNFWLIVTIQWQEVHIVKGLVNLRIFSIIYKIALSFLKWTFLKQTYSRISSSWQYWHSVAVPECFVLGGKKWWKN